jgi:PAS domain S-box-containing protein
MKHPKILAINDTPEDLGLMETLLLEVFPEATIIKSISGKEGIELCLSEKPDVVLIDVAMPRMDGFEICQKLKAHHSTKIIPVIMVTDAGTKKESRIKALECGANAFLAKPVDRSELTAQVRAMIRIKDSEDRKLDENERLADLVNHRTSELENDLKVRKLAEDVLRESEYFFKESQRAAFIGSYKFNILSDLWTASEVLEQIFGIDKDFSHDLQGWLEIVHPDDRKMIMQYFNEEVLAKRKPFNKEYRIIRKSDGETRWVLGLGKLNFDNEDRIIEMLGTIQDITERKQVDETLRESEEKYRRMVDLLPDAIIIHSEGKIVFANKATQKLMGASSSDQIIGANAIDFVHPDDRSKAIARIKKIFVSGDPSEFAEERFIKFDNEVIYAEVIGIPVSYLGKPAVQTILRDITERKKAQDALVESEEKYSILFNDSPDSYLIITDGVFTDCNRATEQMLRADRSMIIGKSPDTLSPEFQPDGITSVESAKEKIEYAFRNGKNTFEWVHRRFDGSDFYVEVSIASMTLRGKPTLFTTWRDITERKQAEEKIKTSEDRYKSFISQVSEGVYRLECDEPMNLNLSVEEQMDYICNHMILDECNEAFVNMYGAGSQNDIIGKAHPFFRGNPDKPVNREALRNFILNGYRAENTITEEVNLSSQTLYFSNNSIGIIENNHLVRIWGTQTDITEKIKADKIQQVLFTISNAALSSVSLPKLIEIISNEIGKLLDSTNFYIAFYDEKTNMLSTIYEKDEKDILDTWPAEKSITGYVIKKQKSLFVKDFEMEELVKQGEIELFGTLSKVWLGVPLMMDNKAIGAVVVQSYDNPDAYTEKDKKMLEFVSYQISISIERKKAEQKLKLLNRAIDQSSVSIVITNKDGLIEFTNPKFTETSGYLPEEVMGKNPKILNSGKHSKEFYRELWQTLTNGNAWNGEICNRRKNGTLYWENVYISPVEGEDGEISHYVGIKEDINEKKLLEETQRITMEISQISITKTSLNSFLKEVHEKLNRIMRADNFYVALYNKFSDTYTLAYHVDEYDKFEIDQPLNLSNGYTDRIRKTGIGQLITTGTINNPENKQKVIGYGKTPSSWLGVPLKSSSESEVIGVIAIQDYKNLNAYTKLEQHTLEVIAKDICVFIERIKNLEDLTKAKERAEESDRLKTAFLANMSHEIRTPLNSIVGFADLMQDPDFDREQYADFAKIINNSGNSLLAIISDIMDISKIEAGQIKVVKTSFQVVQLIRQIHKQYSFVATEKGLNLKINVDNELETLVIESDENRIRQILVNFVGNAIKFTTKGSVEIGAKVQDHVIRFHVKDTGIGIPKEYHTEIFDRFRQVEDSNTRKYGGNGLGLAISKSLVELLGGQIGIESEQGKGSTFYFTVPLKTHHRVL